ncbi:hypothetical protein K4G60_g3876 [Candida parapsilosis]|nr:hypothetical protein K4G60_g3876 [Candida parapsilosis]
MPKSDQMITIKINVLSGKKGEGEGDQASCFVEKTLHARKDDFLSINSKDALIQYINTKLPDLLPKEFNGLNFTRKSKKHKCFIPLDNEEDFKSLGRSLKVKNHVKLNVVVSPLGQEPLSSSTKTSPSSSIPTASTTTATETTDPLSHHYPSIDFARLGDLLLEATLEQFKEFFVENKHKSTGSKTDATTQKVETEIAATAAVAAAKGAADASHSSQREIDPVEEADVVHTNIACDHCCPHDFIPLKGVRYCCLVCPNYDLCAECERRQQDEKLTYGTHSYSHPTVKVTVPDTFSRNIFNDKFNVNGVNSDCDRRNVFPNTRSDNIIYDIPLSSCSDANRVRLETLLQSKGFENFIDEVDSIISRSDKYSRLLRILDANGLSFPHEGAKHQYLESCVEDFLLKKAFAISANDALHVETNNDEEEDEEDEEEEEEEEEEEIKCDAIVTLSLGSTSTKSCIQLINKSEVSIEGGDFKVNLVDANAKEYSTTIKTADVKPGQVKFYKLDAVPQGFVFEDEATLVIEASNMIMTSRKIENNSFQMDFELKESPREDSAESESLSTAKDADRKRIDVNDSFNESMVDGGVHLIHAAYKIQSSVILNLELQNNSNTTFSCNDLRIEVYEEDVKVSESVINKPHGINPGCLTKSNIILKHPITRYPLCMDFYVEDKKRAFCVFAEGQHEADLMLWREGRDSASISSTKEEFELLDENATTRSESATQSSSFHSMVLPVLARESVDLSDYIDANSGSIVREDDHYEYEVFEDNDDGGDEVDSDFEILSLASTDSF